MLRNLEAIQRIRRNEATGWGKTRLERERRKRRGDHQGEARLVVDEQGTVRYADEYEGNLAEGLARYAARIGGRPTETREAQRETGDRRWVSPAGHYERPADAESDTDFGRGGEGAEPNETVPVILTETRERENIQNEIAANEPSDAEGFPGTDAFDWTSAAGGGNPAFGESFEAIEGPYTSENGPATRVSARDKSGPPGLRGVQERREETQRLRLEMEIRNVERMLREELQTLRGNSEEADELIERLLAPAAAVRDLRPMVPGAPRPAS
jgi:hypothetical protein